MKRGWQRGVKKYHFRAYNLQNFKPLHPATPQVCVA